LSIFVIEEQLKTQIIMKKFTLKTIALLAFVTFGFTACSDDDETGRVQTKTIAQIATDNASLSSLVAALDRAGLVEVLNNPGSFTVFAPTNEAFSTFLGAAGFATVNDVPVPVLRQILLNHVVSGTVQSSQLSTGYISTLATFDGVENGNPLNMYVSVNNNQVRLNNVSDVTLPNIVASNGIVHVVNAVIGLPTVVTFATADPTFSTLVAALTELTPATDFATVLSGTGPFTVFAPTNDAFTALDTELAPGGISSLTETTLTSVLNYHVASGNVRSSALTPNGDTVVPTLLSGNSFTITLPGTNGNIANVTDGAGRPDIGIIAVDVQAANGVIHVLNKVILPAP